MTRVDRAVLDAAALVVVGDVQDVLDDVHAGRVFDASQSLERSAQLHELAGNQARADVLWGVRDLVLSED